MVRIFYTVYTWLVFAPIFLVLTILTALITTVGCLLGDEKIFAYYPGMIWSRLTCYLALCPVKVRGCRHINRKQSYIFAANHQGSFDIFLIYGFLGVPIKWVMKASLGKIPFVGAACRAAGFIFVDHSTRKAAARSVVEAEKALKKGASIAIFPEGSRTHDGQMAKFKKGAFQMALDQHLPIIPITLNGPFEVLPIHSLNLKRHKMEMVIHPPISTDGIDTSHNDLKELAEQTHAIVASALWEQYQDKPVEI
ncbi:MAG: 1-acyl-sn-glycerol-3-phosphate acyltransferase [Tannerellaceae bacterium]|jgi:1-acyl-sn-glycerol-3-phosphate acyltransferase|nr:1-acyl-sn-glycerol-3-phosphate acyltransferase [Tannerellaceae bacterium]